MNLSRRRFVKTAATSLVAAGSVLSATGYSSPSSSKKLKVAVVGCGGRCRTDLKNFIKASELLGYQVDVVALADAFEDRAYATADLFEVERSRCIIGWDAYQKVADSEAEFVMLLTPPAFRPIHLKAMVETGKHIMIEKPVAVDAPGCREIIRIGDLADKKGLAILAGTQRRHQLSYLQNKARIDAGAIGEILGGVVMWNGNVPWIWDRKPGMKDDEYLARNWLNWWEMSGDHITEQHVHNLDVANWYLDRLPVSAVGFGGRARRESGNQFDFFSLDLDYGDGVHIHSQCRQISGAYARVGEFFRGTEGEVLGGGKLTGKDVSIPEFEVLDIDGTIQEMVDFINSARDGQPLNHARRIAEATAVAIMGRLAAYTGKLVRLSDLLENEKSEFYSLRASVLAEDFEAGSIVMPPENVIPIPGDGGPIRRKG